MIRIAWGGLVVAVLWGALPAGAEPDSTAAELAVAEPDSAAAEGAALETEASETASRIEDSYFAILVRLGLGLALVVCLAWGAVYLLRRTGLGQQMGAMGGPIRVAGRAYLGPKKGIYLVEIGDRTLALGVTEANITPLAEWPAGELDLGHKEKGSASFATHFRQLMGQARKEEDR